MSIAHGPHGDVGARVGVAVEGGDIFAVACSIDVDITHQSEGGGVVGVGHDANLHGGTIGGGAGLGPEFQLYAGHRDDVGVDGRQDKPVGGTEGCIRSIRPIPVDGVVAAVGVG